MNKIFVYVGDGCAPCGPIKAADVANGNVTIEGSSVLEPGDVEVKLVDITSEEGFPDIEKYGLTGVPSGVVENSEGKHEVCKIAFDEETKKVTLLCGAAATPTDPPPEEPA